MDAESTLTVARLIRAAITRRQWRSVTEREVAAVARRHGADRDCLARLTAEVRRQYSEAGAGYAGRFQA